MKWQKEHESWSLYSTEKKKNKIKKKSGTLEIIRSIFAVVIRSHDHEHQRLVKWYCMGQVNTALCFTFGHIIQLKVASGLFQVL